MKVGFDLDGVLRSIDLGLLKAMKLLPDKDAHWYYCHRLPELNPYLFLHEDDEFYIFSSQKQRDFDLTKRFIEKFYPNAKYTILITEWKPKDWEQPKKVYEKWNKKKAEQINGEDIDVYFEDNPNVVVALRELCPNTKIIQYGGRLCFE